MDPDGFDYEGWLVRRGIGATGYVVEAAHLSSTPPFVATVSPVAVWFLVGYCNRWDFPEEEVVARYRGEGATLAGSASDGALRMLFRPGGAPVLSMRWRLDAARLWKAK